MSALTKDDWINAGLTILKDDGYSKLSIVRIAQHLNVTRGSFYHHFQSLNDFIDALIANWEARIVKQGFDQTLNDESNPAKEFENLIVYVTQLQDRYDLLFRQWAASNDQVKQHMVRLDKLRLSRLVELMQRLAKDQAEGEKLARIAFYAYIGSLHTFPHKSATQQKQEAAEVFDVISGYLKGLN